MNDTPSAQVQVKSALHHLATPATRGEIADLSGLSGNDVSRSLTTLQGRGEVAKVDPDERPARWIVMRNGKPADPRQNPAQINPKKPPQRVKPAAQVKQSPAGRPNDPPTAAGTGFTEPAVPRDQSASTKTKGASQSWTLEEITTALSAKPKPPVEIRALDEKMAHLDKVAAVLHPDYGDLLVEIGRDLLMLSGRVKP